MNWLNQFISAFSKLLTWWVVIAPWEAGLCVRLGKTVKELAPGIHLRIPFLDRLYIQSLRLRTITDNGQTLTTQDNKIVVISIAVEYCIKSLSTVYACFANPEIVILARIQGIVAEYVSNAKSTELTPNKLQNHVTDELHNREDWGIDKMKANIVGFAYVKTYRLLSDNYQRTTNLGDIEYDEGR